MYVTSFRHHSHPDSNDISRVYFSPSLCYTLNCYYSGSMKCPLAGQVQVQQPKPENHFLPILWRVRWGGERKDVPLPLYAHMGAKGQCQCLLKEDLSLNMESTILSRWLASEHLGAFCLHALTRAKITVVCYQTHILYGCWGSGTPLAHQTFSPLIHFSNSSSFLFLHVFWFGWTNYSSSGEPQTKNMAREMKFLNDQC